MNLQADQNRMQLAGASGIYVRAQRAEGQWDSVDIAELTAASLFEWLRSRGGENQWAEATVLILLGHDQSEFPEEIRNG